MPEISEKWALHDTPKTSYKKALGNWPKRLNDYNLFNFWGAAIMVEIELIIVGRLKYFDPLTVKRHIFIALALR